MRSPDRCNQAKVSFRLRHVGWLVCNTVSFFLSFFVEKCETIDYFVLGDGERPTLHLIDCLAEGRVPTDPAVEKITGK